MSPAPFFPNTATVSAGVSIREATAASVLAALAGASDVADDEETAARAVALTDALLAKLAEPRPAVLDPRD